MSVTYKVRHRLRSRNWLVHRIHDAELGSAVDSYAGGLLLDIGCGEKPYQALTQCLVSVHLGFDHPSSLHSKQQIDVFGTAYKTGVADNSIDTLLCTVVMERLERPQDALYEMHRILKPGGHVILSAPLFWHLHEEPRDFDRYTKYGLAHLFSTAGFEIVEIKPLAGFVVTFGQELVYFINYFHRGPLRLPISVVQSAIQLLAYGLNRWDRSSGFTWAYPAVARKRV